MIARAALVALLAGSAAVGAAAGDATGEPAALFEAPAPGSYALPPIETVGRHRLLDADGREATLLDLAPGEVAFVALVYLSCHDGHGCPHALAVLQRLDREVAADPALAGRVRLVTVSFDPARDTPERLAALRDGLRPRGRWQFLTAAGPAELAPVLADYGQDVLALRGPGDQETGELRHVLKVFLVDDARRLRNIYSAGFLDVRILRNDALTVLGENRDPTATP